MFSIKVLYLRVSTYLSIPESNQLSVHTWECPVSSVDPSVQQTEVSLLTFLDDCSSAPALSDGRGWSSELRPEKHSLPLWPDILTDLKYKKIDNTMFFNHKYQSPTDVVQNNWHWSEYKAACKWSTVKISLRVSFILIVQDNKIIDAVSWPESFQCTVWTLQSSRQQLDSWILQVVVTQVKLSQMGGVGVQSWGQRSTAFLCDQTSWQTWNIKRLITQCFLIISTRVLQMLCRIIDIDLNIKQHANDQLLKSLSESALFSLFKITKL